MTPEEALQTHFGLPSFRQPQGAIIDAVLARKDTLVVMDVDPRNCPAHPIRQK
jgi:superfamily II DNA helicase RecQ